MSGRKPKLHRMESNNTAETVAADVVFLHGLGGDYRKTWTSQKDPHCYFPELLQKDLPQVRVWSLNYPANWTQWWAKSAPMGLEHRAGNLAEHLISCGIGDKSVFFVCHSLGGLLAKKILRQSYVMKNNARYYKIAKNTVGVSFLATPHTGSQIANIAGYVNRISGGSLRKSKLVTELEAQSAHLEELNTWYRNTVDELEIENIAYSEGKKFRRLLIVDRDSADPKLKGCPMVSTDVDHEEICKPVNRECTIYISVRDFIEDKLKRNRSAPAPPKPLPKIDTARMPVTGPNLFGREK
ncbi:MAG: hypothetical protein GY757_40815, partial [bacterium]|nr:hypothetical protein [bacterium]